MGFKNTIMLWIPSTEAIYAAVIKYYALFIAWLYMTYSMPSHCENNFRILILILYSDMQHDILKIYIYPSSDMLW